jgi:hypothetical protein
VRQIPSGGEQARRHEQRVTRQEEADEQSGFGEDDGEEADGAEGAEQLVGLEPENGDQVVAHKPSRVVVRSP